MKADIIFVFRGFLFFFLFFSKFITFRVMRSADCRVNCFFRLFVVFIRLLAAN